MNKIKKNLVDKGWSIIKANKLSQIQNISKDFLNEFKKSYELKSILKKEKIKNIDNLRKFSNTVDDKTLNYMKKIYLHKCSEQVVKAFSSTLLPIFGNKLFIQKHPQIQFHRGLSSSRITFPHNEMMAAHSPYTYNIWFPFHEITGNCGIFLIDDRQSVKFCDLELKKNIKSREKTLKKHHFFPQLKLGEAIIFNAFVYHGAVYHKYNSARISVDIRFIKHNQPFLERFTDFFKKINL